MTSHPAAIAGIVASVFGQSSATRRARIGNLRGWPAFFLSIAVVVFSTVFINM
jgi:hypothetical protein